MKSLLLIFVVILITGTNAVPMSHFRKSLHKVGTSCNADGEAGICKSTTECVGVSIAGHCPGASNIQCCIIKSCSHAGQTGNCQSAASCNGATQSGLCPGDSSYKCCLDSTSSSSETSPPSNSHTETSHSTPSTPSEVGEDNYVVLTDAGSTCPADRRQTQICKENYGSSCGTVKEIGQAGCCTTSIVDGFTCEEVKPQRNVGYFQSTLSPPPEISRKEILERALVWLNTRVRYSQLRYHSDPKIDDGLGYRTDCSGFVGMAWKILAFSTSWARGQLDSGSTTIFSGIPCKDLLPGDALVNNGHIVLFRKWKSKSEGSFVTWEEMGSAHGTVESSKTFQDWDENSAATGFKTGGSSTYRCMRRANLVDDAPSEEQIPSGTSDSDTSVPGSGECGPYSGPTTTIEGNDHVKYECYKIALEHWAGSESSLNLAFDQKDNTIEKSAACAFARMYDAAKAEGVELKITSGFRVLARQQYFYDCYINKNCNNGNLAARPGTSNHGRGKALDIANAGGKHSNADGNFCKAASPKVYVWLQQHASEHGFIRTVNKECWHWEYRPGEPAPAYQ